MFITDTHDIKDLVAGASYSITLTGLGSRVSKLKFRNRSGFHEFESGGTSTGDVFEAIIVVPPDPNEVEATLRVELSAGSETVELNYIQLHEQ